MRTKLSRRAAGLTEYIVIVVLVAISLVAAVKMFGWRVQEKYIGSDIQVDQLEATK
ncbi:MAG: hypothetical protein HY720_19450 [Planctomycetes bacterium]|nr:hypothetical protein [Planctomycetota bacterium]